MSTRTRPTRKPARKYQHFLESLESRIFLSVSDAEYAQIRAMYPDLALPANKSAYNIIEITANNLNESAIKDAITAAGNSTANDLIVVRTTATQNKITLNGSELFIRVNAASRGSVTIVSLGTTPLTIDANQESSVFYIGYNADVTLAGLTITNGLTEFYGGGIFNSGTLTVAHSTIENNWALGVYEYARSVRNDKYENGRYVYTYYNYYYTGTASGGGICSMGELTITSSTITGNGTIAGPEPYQDHVVGTTRYYYYYTDDHTGGGIYSDGQLTVNNSTISGNTTGGQGGGIYSDSSDLLTVTNSNITGNKASSDGGGIYSSSSDMSMITNSNITENTTYNNGGGIHNTGKLTVIDSTIKGNTASATSSLGSGGGICNIGSSSTLTVLHSDITENVAYWSGGGICSFSGTVNITNSTFTGNMTTYSVNGGGIQNHSGSTMNVTDSTFTGNKSYDGGGIANSGTMTVTNSTFTGNIAYKLYNGSDLAVQRGLCFFHCGMQHRQRFR
ncbi:MAG: right-handed parallel beta-helix repeat-containing protein [Phycisphaerales bacterium]|nr:right-handed parallel beta-helix repeat-containing protein [Phycisphaerales bacterium]